LSTLLKNLTQNSHAIIPATLALFLHIYQLLIRI
jgi:hypothetical protein